MPQHFVSDSQTVLLHILAINAETDYQVNYQHKCNILFCEINERDMIPLGCKYVEVYIKYEPFLSPPRESC